MARSLPGLPPPRPIPIKDRASLLFLEKGRLDVLDGAFVLVDEAGVRVHIPIGGIVCLMLEPGTRVSHAAVALAARAGTLLIWVGEAGVRLYAAGQPGGARSDRLLYQARLALDDEARLKVVRKMYALRFRVFPAGAGMNRHPAYSPQEGPGVPRRRGDEPAPGLQPPGGSRCSPQARG